MKQRINGGRIFERCYSLAVETYFASKSSATINQGIGPNPISKNACSFEKLRLIEEVSIAVQFTESSIQWC